MKYLICLKILIIGSSIPTASLMAMDWKLSREVDQHLVFAIKGGNRPQFESLMQLPEGQRPNNQRVKEHLLKALENPRLKFVNLVCSPECPVDQELIDKALDIIVMGDQLDKPNGQSRHHRPATTVTLLPEEQTTILLRKAKEGYRTYSYLHLEMAKTLLAKKLLDIEAIKSAHLTLADDVFSGLFKSLTKYPELVNEYNQIKDELDRKFADSKRIKDEIAQLLAEHINADPTVKP